MSAVPAALSPRAPARPGTLPLPARAAASLARVAATLRLEVRLNLLTPAPWVVGLVLAALGYLNVRTATDQSSFPLGWALSQEVGPLAAVLLLLLAASLAYRPLRYEVTEIQDSKVVASEEILLGRWLGMVAAVLVPLLIEYGVTMLGQRIHAPRNPVLPLAYALSLGRLLPAVLFLTTLAFCLVTLTRVLILGAGLAGLLWFALFMGQIYYPSVFRIELSQNRFVFLGLTLSALFLMLLGYQAGRRARRSRATPALAVCTGLLFAVTLLHAAWTALALPSKVTSTATWKRLRAARRKKEDPLPNFAWTDIRARRVSLASLRGRPALLVLLQPKDAGLLPLLRRLAAFQKEFTADQLSVLAVFLSEDLEGAGHAARLAGAAPTVITDWGLPAGTTFDFQRPPSAFARVLEAGRTPTALLLDADGKVTQRDLPVDEGGWDTLKTRVREAVSPDAEPAEEPAAPEEDAS